MSDIRIRVGTFTSTVTFSATDQQVADVLRRFVQDRMTPPPDEWTAVQKNQYALDQALAEIVRMVKQEAIRIRFRELQEQQGSIEEQAITESEL